MENLPNGVIFSSFDYHEEENQFLCDTEWEETLKALDEEQTEDTAKITGKLGLWDGTHEIEPVETETVSEAVEKCLGKCDDITIEKVAPGELEITSYHHDGRNRFTVKY